MTETELLRRIQRRFRLQPEQVLLGPGDDAAVLRVPQGAVLVASQDDLAEGTHFERKWAEPALIARKLLGANLSDLAAMGRVAPLGCLVSAGLPGDLPASWPERFLEGLARASARLGVPVVGGNLARSKNLFFSMSILGAARPDGLRRRGGARPGELLAGAGPLGEAAAGLDLLRRGRVPAWGRSLCRAFWAPPPQLETARRIAGLVTSLMDNSDGLARSARIMSEASRAGFQIDLSRAPASPALRRWCAERGKDLRRRQWLGGEDYGLVFTVRERDWPRLKRLAPRAYLLGRVVRRGVSVRGLSALEGGFEHFP